MTLRFCSRGDHEVFGGNGRCPPYCSRAATTLTGGVLRYPHAAAPGVVPRWTNLVPLAAVARCGSTRIAGRRCHRPQSPIATEPKSLSPVATMLDLAASFHAARSVFGRKGRRQAIECLDRIRRPRENRKRKEKKRKEKMKGKRKKERKNKEKGKQKKKEREIKNKNREKKINYIFHQLCFSNYIDQIIIR
jgi:hypothetical protein